MSQMVERAYKYRCYPTPEQVEQLNRISGCVWYVYNRALDRWYPRSKTCSDCGQLLRSLPLNVWEWTCADCGAAHDRDGNAAKNVLAGGLSVIACGDGVRPPRS